ncbi:hypothetical protein TNCV_520911 [Trichonephila clavipes]|nr:hypothetical protein TNCV_520911 [Trichonephila clavipes]
MGHERKIRQKKRKFHGNFRTAQKVSEGSISSEKLGRGLSDTLFNVDSKLFLDMCRQQAEKMYKRLRRKRFLTDKIHRSKLFWNCNSGNVGNLQTAVIAAFFIVAPPTKNPCMDNAFWIDTWCKYQRPSKKQEGKLYKHRTAGLQMLY